MDDEEGEVEMEQSETTDDSAHKWLQETIVSVSPAADLIALANENKLVLLARMYWSVCCFNALFHALFNYFT